MNQSLNPVPDEQSPLPRALRNSLITGLFSRDSTNRRSGDQVALGALSARSSRSFGYRLGPKASAMRASNSFFTSVFGSGSSTGKCSEPLVLMYCSVSSASCPITDPLCGR